MEFGHGITSKLRNEEAGELVADQHETGGHQHGVGRESLACEGIAAAPEPHRDEDRAERQQLPDLDADIERQDVEHQAVARQFEILQLGRQAEAMEEAEDQDGDLGVRSEEHTSELQSLMR